MRPLEVAMPQFLTRREKVDASRVVVHTQIQETGVVANPGEWIVRYLDGVTMAMLDVTFREMFEPCPGDDQALFQWEYGHAAK